MSPQQAGGNLITGFDYAKLSGMQEGFQSSGIVVVYPQNVPLTERGWRNLAELAQPGEDEAEWSTVYTLSRDQATAEGHQIAPMDGYTFRKAVLTLEEAKQEAVKTNFIDILGSNELIEFYKALLGVNAVKPIRSIQCNLFEPGHWIGFHNHSDYYSNDSAAAIFHLNDDFEGGEYKIRYGPEDRSPQDVATPKFSVVFTRNDIDHSVQYLTRGRRFTIVVPVVPSDG